MRANLFKARIVSVTLAELRLNHSVSSCRSNQQSEHWHLDIAPETAVRRINGATHLLCGCADIDNVNRGHLRAEVKQPGWGDGLSVGTIHAGENNPVFLPIRAHEVSAHVRIEKWQKPSAQILETRQANISRRH